MDTQPDQADQADLPDLPEMVSATAARSLPSTRARGQDYGSLTNSLKGYRGEVKPDFSWLNLTLLGDTGVVTQNAKPDFSWLNLTLLVDNGFVAQNRR